MKSSFFKNKKCNFLAILIIFIVIFVFGVTVVISKTISDNFLEEWNEAVDPPAEQIALQEQFTEAFLIYDWSMLFLVVGLIIGLMITSFLIPTHPVFMVINIVGIFILVAFGMVITNLYADIAGGDEMLTETALEFPRLNFVMQYLPYIGAIAVMLATIIMYSRGTSMPYGGGGGNY